MAQRFSDESVATATRAVVIAAGVVLAKLRDPEFLAAMPSTPEIVEEADTPAERGRLASLARQGGERARRGVAVGLERWAAERPGSPRWDTLSTEDRCAWWLSRMGTLTAALAALPGLAGAAAGQIPVGDLVSAAGQALLLCAIAQEYGVEDRDDQVELVARVVLGRELAAVGGGRAVQREAQDRAGGLAPELAERPASSRARAFAAGMALVRMGRSLTSLQDELDERPRGHVGQRMAGNLPVVGLVGQFRGERRGLRIVAEQGREWCEVRRAQIGPSVTPAPRALTSSVVPPAAPTARRAADDGAGRVDRWTDMTKSDVLVVLRSIGDARIAQGDRFEASRFVDGHFFYETGDRKVGVVVWGDGTSWRLSVFSAARVAMVPTYELYRYVSRWRGTNGVGAPYVVEDGKAAVLCETTICSNQLTDDVSAWRLIASTIDLVGDMARCLGQDLAGADGMAFTAEGEVGLTLLCSWWEVRDERVERVLGR